MGDVDNACSIGIVGRIGCGNYKLVRFYRDNSRNNSIIMQR